MPGLFAGDTLLVHGHIYTGNPKAPWAQALAISGTRIAEAGTDQQILARRTGSVEQAVNAYTQGSAYAKVVMTMVGGKVVFAETK